MQPRSGKDSLIAVMFFVLALGALAEAVIGRSAISHQASSWPAVLQAADAARERGDVPAARRAYLTALFRARGEGSLVGVLGAAEGFKALGDREVVAQALEIASRLEPDPSETPASVRSRLQALRERLAAADAAPVAVPTVR